MDITRAREIIEALAEGIDPTTGEVLPDNHVCNKGEIVRALYVALKTMEAKPKRNQPENAGKPWTAEDDQLLTKLFNNGMSPKELSAHFERSSGSISSRLAKLGLADK